MRDHSDINYDADPGDVVAVTDTELPDDDEACCADPWVAAANYCGCRGRRTAAELPTQTEPREDPWHGI